MASTSRGPSGDEQPLRTEYVGQLGRRICKNNGPPQQYGFMFTDSEGTLSNSAVTIFKEHKGTRPVFHFMWPKFDEEIPVPCSPEFSVCWKCWGSPCEGCRLLFLAKLPWGPLHCPSCTTGAHQATAALDYVSPFGPYQPQGHQPTCEEAERERKERATLRLQLETKIQRAVQYFLDEEAPKCAGHSAPKEKHTENSGKGWKRRYAIMQRDADSGNLQFPKGIYPTTTKAEWIRREKILGRERARKIKQKSNEKPEAAVDSARRLLDIITIDDGPVHKILRSDSCYSTSTDIHAKWNKGKPKVPAAPQKKIVELGEKVQREAEAAGVTDKKAIMAPTGATSPAARGVDPNKECYQLPGRPQLAITKISPPEAYSSQPSPTGHCRLVPVAPVDRDTLGPPKRGPGGGKNSRAAPAIPPDEEIYFDIEIDIHPDDRTLEAPQRPHGRSLLSDPQCWESLADSKKRPERTLGTITLEKCHNTRSSRVGDQKLRGSPKAGTSALAITDQPEHTSGTSRVVRYVASPAPGSQTLKNKKRQERRRRNKAYKRLVEERQ